MRLTISLYGFPLLVLVGLLALTGCREEPEFQPGGDLGFSTDTLRFDTIFQNTLSPSERLRIHNDAGKPLLIEEIYIEGGADSPFELTLDGVQQQRITDYEMYEDDSILAFVRMRADVEDEHRLLRDYLVFRTGDNVQRVPLEVWVLNAYLLQDTVIEGDVSLPSDTLIVVDGFIYVDSMATLRINPGTELYFTARRDQNFQPFSQILVDGRLVVEGQPGNEVLFTNNRLGEGWRDTPGDWKGIRFLRHSENNFIRHAIIENASIGVQADSLQSDGTAKLVIENSIIRNMSNYGLLGIGAAPNITEQSAFIIDGRNLLIYNCGLSGAGFIYGGNYRLLNSTVVEYGWNFQRDQPAVVFTNVLRFQENDGTEVAIPYPAYFTAINNIFYGSTENEFGTDLVQGAPAELNMGYCLIRAEEEAGFGEFEGNILNQAPLFRERSNFDMLDLQLQEGSPAIGAGIAIQGLTEDLVGTSRDDPPELGAYEYTPPPDDD